MSIPVGLALAIFAVSAVVVAYAYVGYPLLLRLLAKWFGQSPNPLLGDESSLPSLTLLIVAHNEETHIEERIRNALALEYPADRINIVIATDGCNDGTNAIVRRYTSWGVRLIQSNERRGKPAMLNLAMSQINTDIVVLSDANTFMDRHAAGNLARWFADPAVGVVCGRLVLTDPETGRNADSLYWKYETFLKCHEGRLGALLGANGGIYAIRKELFRPIAPETIIDDLLIPLDARLRTDCQILYDQDAVAYEETPASIDCEFGRRSRIGAGGFQSLVTLRRLFDPRRGWIAFTFFSHKLLRWLCPFFLLTLLASNFFLLEMELFRLVLALQLAFYAVANLFQRVPSQSRLLKPLLLPAMFTSMNLALLVGFGRWALGLQKPTWNRTLR